MENKEKIPGTPVNSFKKSSGEAAAERLPFRERAVIRKKIAWLEHLFGQEGSDALARPVNWQYYAFARRLDDVFIDTVIEWYEDVRSEYEARLSGARCDVENTLRNLVSGAFFPSVRASAVKNAVADYIEGYNDNLPHFFIVQIGVLATNAANRIRIIVTDSDVSFTDSPAALINLARRGISAATDMEYDLEYRGELPNFSTGPRWPWCSDAEECSIAKPLDFVCRLDRSFQSMLNSTIDDVYLNCLGSVFLKTVLEPCIRHADGAEQK